MNTLLTSPSDLIEVRRAENRGRGARGVFARRAIANGSEIERAPVLLIPRAQVFGDTPESRKAARISWYVFEWSHVTKRPYVALALGYGSIYNHSDTPNARYLYEAPDILVFEAIREIAEGEEIFINYGGEGERKPMAFEVKQ